MHAYPSRNPRLTCQQCPEADAQCRKVVGPWPSRTGHRRLPSRLCGACCKIASRDCAKSVCSPSFPAEGRTLGRPPAYPGGRKSGGRSHSNRNSVHGNTDFPLEKQKVICVFKHVIFQKICFWIIPLYLYSYLQRLASQTGTGTFVLLLTVHSYSRTEDTRSSNISEGQRVPLRLPYQIGIHMYMHVTCSCKLWGIWGM